MTESREQINLDALRMSDGARGRRRSGFPWRRWGAGLIVLAALGIALRMAPLPMNRPRVATIPAQVLTRTAERTVLTATGYTYARERAAVGAKIIGRVVRLGVDEGDRVEKGTLIAELDSADLRARVQAARARVEQAEATLADAEREEQRQHGLLGDALTSQAIYDAALTRLAESRAVLGTARADLQAAEAQSGYATILSPIPGIVIERNVEVGEMVAPGGFTSQQSTGAIVRIANLESLEVEADINESYIARVEIGQPVVIKVDAVPDHPYRGRLRQVVPTADRQRGTVQVKVTIEDRDQRLVPDMSCSVSFLEPGTDPASLDAAPRIMVPVSAVLEERGERHVLVVESGRVRKVTVTVGPVEGDRIEIRSGLRGGEAVIREPGDGRKEGARVRAVPS